MSDDAILLRRYSQEKDDDAFAELVHRHINLVYSAALRQLEDDAHAAADVSQLVFAELARKSARLTRHSSIPGWLYTTTRQIASNRRRSEMRRTVREQQAHAMQELLRESTGSSESVDWNRLRPVLDDAMHALGKIDREALLSRFFERRSLANIGERLGINENAARMRVARALEKLRSQLGKRGITSTAAALAVCLPECATAGAPPSLVTSIISAAPAAAAMAPWPALAVFRQQAAFALFLILTAAFLYFQQDKVLQLQNENHRLQERAALKISIPLTPRDAPEKIESDLLEIARLRAEIVRLRSGYGATPATAKMGGTPGDYQPLAPADYSAEVKIPTGKTLILGGWPISKNKRLLIFLSSGFDSIALGDKRGSLQADFLAVPNYIITAHGLLDLDASAAEPMHQMLIDSQSGAMLFKSLAESDGVELKQPPWRDRPTFSSPAPWTRLLADEPAKVYNFAFAPAASSIFAMDYIPRMAADCKLMTVELGAHMKPASMMEKPQGEAP